VVKRAVISDIHGNIEALEAVLADAREQGATKFYCLGDIVGYGPNPRECVDRVLSFDAVILGNHDQGALYDPEGFSSGAERAIFWTRDQLETVQDDAEQAAKRWDFLSQLPRTVREPQCLFVHGSPRNPLNEYVFPEDVYNQRKLERLFALVDRFSFQGHTHVPGIFTEDNRFQAPAEFGYQCKLPSGKAMINVGSVGQPRDGDPRACYVLLSEEQLEYRRVTYDFTKTAAKIYAIPELDRFLGDRLARGQ
jgi:diadenosine tetraphosphatase ApaH/serine/threonine PP2A family protein phosphatase